MDRILLDRLRTALVCIYRNLPEIDSGGMKYSGILEEIWGSLPADVKDNFCLIHSFVEDLGDDDIRCPQ